MYFCLTKGVHFIVRAFIYAILLGASPPARKSEAYSSWTRLVNQRWRRYWAPAHQREEAEGVFAANEVIHTAFQNICVFYNPAKSSL